jgi:hypothetical protein
MLKLIQKKILIEYKNKMAKKKLQDKVTMNGEISFLHGSITDDGSNLRLENFIYNKLKSKGYNTYDRFRYKIVLEHKKE